MQTSVLQEPASYVVGQNIYPGPRVDIRTGVAEAALSAGLFVAQGTAARGLKLPAATTDATSTACMGVVLRDPTAEPGANPIGAAVPVMRKGVIAVQAQAGTYVKGQAVYVRCLTSGFGTIDAASSANTGTCPYAEVVESKALAALGAVLIELKR